MEILVEKIKVDKTMYFEFHRAENSSDYIIRGYVYNRQIYGRRFDRRFFNAYKEFIKQRLIYISELQMYSYDYTMIEIGKRMYKRVDPFSHFMELRQCLVPADYEIDDDYIEFDLLTDCGMSDGIIYPDCALVFKFGNFYHKGNKLASLEEVLENVIYGDDDETVEVTAEDLKYGIPKNVLKYLTVNYYSPDFKLYITDYCTTNIDKWY